MNGQVVAWKDEMLIEWESLVNHTKLAQFSTDDMDTDFDSMVKDMVMTHHVFQPESSSLKTAIVEQNISSISEILGNELLESDWSKQLARALTTDLISKCHLNSYPFINKPKMNQSHRFNSRSLSHLDSGMVGVKSAFPDNASQHSDEEIIISTRRCSAFIIDDYDEDMYNRYHLLMVVESPTLKIYMKLRFYQLPQPSSSTKLPFMTYFWQ